MTKESRKALTLIIKELATNKTLTKKDIAIRIELAYEHGMQDANLKHIQWINESLKPPIKRII